MTTVKLSKYQQKVLDEAKKKIDRARNCKTVYEYLKEVRYLSDEKINSLENNNLEILEIYANTWNNEKNAVVIVNSNIKTIQKLERLGYIKIIEISKDRSRIIIDTVQVLNY